MAISRANRWDVRIRWSDGHEAVYPADYLRRACCCAVCLEGGLAPADIPADVHPLEIRAVGNYAIRFAWSDGHTAGVYPFGYLRALCPCPDCRQGAER
ncbi:MAG TPA: DUF971 domain-containing protein [Gemmatimonadales bacterium]|nr:DUF971 domain-containing protein [Gemmatimonadales bacterium]